MSTDLDLGDVFTRADSSVYVSSIFDAGSAASWDTVSWTPSEPPTTWIHIFARAGNWPTPPYAWTDWMPVENGGNVPSALDGRRYFQYKAILGTAYYVATPILKEIRFDFSPTGIAGEAGRSGAPGSFALFPSRPNPFRERAEVRYEIPVVVSNLSLSVFNLNGQVVRLLASGPHQPGAYTIAWDGRDDQGQKVAAGVYLYQLSTELFRDTRKMILLR